MRIYLEIQIWESLALFQHILSASFIQDFGKWQNKIIVEAIWEDNFSEGLNIEIEFCDIKTPSWNIPS